MSVRGPNQTLHATAVGVAVQRRSVRSIILFPSDAGAHPAVRELFRSATRATASFETEIRSVW